ncbi:response regulator transcription factor [Paenibacillus sp. J2TS4]|uniref:response regulator transcription factor n=1 Tax=Paenibacillus sp. J2TS4 TaxID=2807194 RepID=UPI001B0FE874|nr:response regulator transcription factor [Paenibacillus sp. J2TS4]GIP31497.1 DNA-binding response regulator [Paenibacillus sp. J2TS4]
MYKVLLVDDEPLITKGLQALLNWEDYGFEIIQIAENGKEALEYVNENLIHLLVTDILMPKMSGLELIEEAKKIQPHIKCIILSGYREFTYVKQGMMLGIENYLLKPVDEEELLNTIQAVSQKFYSSSKEVLEAEFTTLKDNTLWRLLNGEINKNEWHERLSLYEMNVAQPHYNVSIIQFENNNNIEVRKSLRSEIERQYLASCLYNPDQELIIIFSGQNEQELYLYNQQLVSVLQNKAIGHFYLSMGQAVDSMEKLEDSYLFARELSLFQVCLPLNTLISNQVHMNRQKLLNHLQRLKTKMVKRILNAEQSLLEKIEKYYETMKKNKPFLAPAVARKYTIDLVSYIYHSIHDVKHYNHTAAIERLVFAADIKQMKNILLDYCSELMNTIDHQQDNRSPIVQNVLQYMHTHYHNELSLKTLSQRFHVNPIYLGQLFQKEIGVVFSEYINRYRLEKAKELLKTTHLRTGEISKRVGYSDTAYFYKQFKRNVGTTPTEWRNL